MCTMGESSTGMYSYKVWAFRLRFIITSNKWMELAPKVKSDADREWLQKNSVYHHCTEALYEGWALTSAGGAVVSLCTDLSLRAAA